MPSELEKKFASTRKYSGLFLVSDVTNLPFKNSVFEGYVSLGVLEHFKQSKDVGKTFEEAFRVLKTSGKAYFSVMNPVTLGSIFAKMFNVFGSSVYRHRIRDLVLLGQNAGFKITKLSMSGSYYFPYILFRFIFRKEVWPLKQAMKSSLGKLDELAPFCYLGSSLSIVLRK